MMDEDYFLAKLPTVECKKHGEKIPFTLGHRRFCPDCVADHLEKTIGQAVVK